jgi:hypothetical protein
MCNYSDQSAISGLPTQPAGRRLLQDSMPVAVWLEAPTQLDISHSLVLLGALDAWPASELWNDTYLRQKSGNAQITVDLTPNGRGDAVVHVPTQHPTSTQAATTQAGAQGKDFQGGTHWFVTPYEARMSLPTFFQLLRQSRASAGPTRVVPYVQHQ